MTFLTRSQRNYETQPNGVLAGECRSWESRSVSLSAVAGQANAEASAPGGPIGFTNENVLEQLKRRTKG